MSTTAYKNRRSGRVLTEQAPVSRGVNFTHQEVPAGYAKLLVNYNLKNNGAALVPREAYRSNDANDGKLIVSDQAFESTPDLGPAHFAGMLYVEEATDDTLYLADVVLSVGNVSVVDLTPDITKGNYDEALKLRLDHSVAPVYIPVDTIWRFTGAQKLVAGGIYPDFGTYVVVTPEQSFVLAYVYDEFNYLISDGIVWAENVDVGDQIRAIYDNYYYYFKITEVVYPGSDFKVTLEQIEPLEGGA